MIRKAIILLMTLGAVGIFALAMLSLHRSLELGKEWSSAQMETETDAAARGSPVSPPLTQKWAVHRWPYPICWCCGNPYSGSSAAVDETRIVLHRGVCTIDVQRQLPIPLTKSIRSFGWRWLSLEVGVRSASTGDPLHHYRRFRCPLVVPLVLLGAYPTIAFIRGPLRHWRRRDRGLCLECGYDLTGIVSGICPECGTSVP